MSNRGSHSVRAFEQLAEAVPRYESFFTVAEHRERDRALAAESDHVTYEEVDDGGDGESPWVVTAGSGDRTALLLAAPHPNEPVGSMTIDFLLHELAENDALRASLDYQVVAVPVADPDDVRRNEGWFDGPFTLSNYAQNFYRPPADGQVEATFPIEHEEYVFEDPTPATRTIASLIERHRPEFVYSLHNAAFGGCYYYLSDPLDDLYGTLQEVPETYDLPLHQGEPEGFSMETFDDAVFRLPTFEDQYDGAQAGDANPEEVLFGGNAYDYASQFRDDVVCLVAEVPYFYDPRIQEQTELDRSREAVIREGIEHRQPVVREIRAASRAVAEHLPETPMTREATGVADYFAREWQAKLDWAESAPETDDPATVAQYVDERFLRQYHLLPYCGMLLRAIDHAAMTAEGDVRERLVDTKRALESVFDDRIAELQRELDYEAIPIRDLVAIQARAGLLCMDYQQRSEM